MNLKEMVSVPIMDENLSFKQKVLYDIHDTIRIVEKLNGVQRYWFIVGVGSGLGLSLGLLMKSRFIGYGLGIIGMVCGVGSLVAVEKVIKEDSEKGGSLEDILGSLLGKKNVQ